MGKPRIPPSPTRKITKVIASFVLMGALGVAIWDFVDAVDTADLRVNPGSVAARALPNIATAEYYSVFADALLRQADIDWARATIATETSIKLDPTRVENWNRLAFISASQKGWLTPKARDALARSFEVSPFGSPEIMKWRLRFSHTHWDFLPAEIKRASLAQIRALYLEKTHQRWVQKFADGAHPDIQHLIADISRNGAGLAVETTPQAPE